MKRLLVIACGGTIASRRGERGLMPLLDGEDVLQYMPASGTADIEFDVAQPMNIDSTDMRPCDWLTIAAEIERAYELYDGFIVVQGTDTLAYTAAALSYLVQGGSKPIVLTGSQLPVMDEGSDAPGNLRDAVTVAGDEDMSDVVVVVAGRVIAGTRASKRHTLDADAFASVNYPDLARVRAGRAVHADVPMSTCGGDAPPARPRFFHQLDERVALLKLAPGFDGRMVDALRGTCDALVVECFGRGGVPSYGELDRAFDRWLESGGVLALTTQVAHGGCDLAAYEVGSAYVDRAGVVCGADMSTEALYAKTMWALGQTDDVAEAIYLIEMPIGCDRV